MNKNAYETTKFIKAKRSELNVTQSVFAKMVGKKRDDIASYETGRAVPPGYVILRIMKLFP